MADEASGSKGNKIVLIATIINTVGMLGVIALTILSFQKEKQRESLADIAGSHGEAHSKVERHGDGEHEDADGDKSHADGKGKAYREADQSAKIIPLEPFTINLATTAGGAARYLRMNLSIELSEGNTDDEIKNKSPKIRDAIINILNSKKPSDLSTPEGRDLLKEDIKRTLNGFLVSSKIQGVYFTNFAVN
jgi:flagellar FliL protein